MPYTLHMKGPASVFFKFCTYVFALIGLVLVMGYGALRLGLTTTEGIVDTGDHRFIEKADDTYTVFPLAHTPEWVAFRIAIAKDKQTLDRVSKETGLSERLLVALVVPEQMRLFYTNRPLFKEVFSPLKILGSQSQFSWGILGIKEDTAQAVETHLNDQASPFYLGGPYSHMLDFKTENHDSERFDRIINDESHYYSYLYAALFILQIEKQWKDQGIPISTRPDIIATLWNIGFNHSHPHDDPLSGGSSMDIGTTTYSFGRLAKDFYDSDEMIELFPR
jgi:hypothetical protein